jgi:hypothetical protein
MISVLAGNNAESYCIVLKRRRDGVGIAPIRKSTITHNMIGDFEIIAASLQSLCVD